MTGGFELQVLSDLPPGLIAQEARQLEAALGRAGLSAKPYKMSAQPGQKGILEDFTKLVLEHTLVPIGLRLLDGLRQYFVREQRVVVELTRPDGAKIKVDAKNVGSEKVAAFLSVANEALG
jgi:hypothetical protein